MTTYVQVPCRVRVPLSMEQGASQFTMTVHRLRFESADIMNGRLSFGQSENFKVHRKMFEEFAVKGVSIKYMPANVATGTTFVAAPNTGEVKPSGLMEPIVQW